MGFSAKVLADSIAPCGSRLTTIEATYPRFIHAEIMTHRILSRNAASSRAIPALKMIARVEAEPVIPVWWGKNEPGMQAWAEVEDKDAALGWWLEGQRMMVEHARKGTALGLHKQIVNRVLEPWMWITVIMSATSWSNLFGLRVHKDAEPHFQRIAGMMKAAMAASAPQQLGVDEWHTPLIFPVDRWAAFTLVTGRATDPERLLSLPDKHPDLLDIWRDLPPQTHREIESLLVKASVGRCARVSYLTHDGRRDLAEDVALHDKLVVAAPLHASPAEHVAKALGERRRIGNFVGWHQYRKMLVNEHIGEAMP